MKTKNILFACSVFITVQLKAQTVEFIEPRNVQNVPEAEFSTYKVGDYFYVLQKRYRMMAPVMYDLQLDAYDAARKPVGSNMIDKTLEMGDANIFQGVFAMKDRLVMFKSEYSKASGSKMSYMWCYPFDVTGKRLKKEQLVTINAESAFNSGNFGVNVSPDGTKLAVLSELPYDKEGMEKCVVTVFDEKLKQSWKKEYTFPYESAKAPKNEILVNNNGVVFILKKIAVKKAFDQFSVFSFLENGKTVTEKKIELDNGFAVSSWKNVFSAEGNLQLAGFYYMDKKVGINVETPDGTFYLEVSAANGDLKASKSGKVRSAGIKAIQLLPTPDKGLVLIGESVTEKSTPKPGASFEYNYEYRSGSTYVIKLGTDGSFLWDYAVQKDMSSGGDGGRLLHSYAWLNGSDVNVLYTDRLSNHDNKKQFIEFGSRYVNVYQVIGADGKPKGEVVITDQRIGGKKGEYLFIPATGNTYNNNKIFMLATRGLELVGATVQY
jgi:hypothetical protein